MYNVYISHVMYCTCTMLGSEEAVPVVRWKKPVLPQDESPSLSEWKILPPPPPPHLSSPLPSQPLKRLYQLCGGRNQSYHKMNLKLLVSVTFLSPSISVCERSDVLLTPATEEAVPVVRWKKPVIPQDEPQTTGKCDVSLSISLCV